MFIIFNKVIRRRSGGVSVTGKTSKLDGSFWTFLDFFAVIVAAGGSLGGVAASLSLAGVSVAGRDSPGAHIQSQHVSLCLQQLSGAEHHLQQQQRQ